MFLLKNLGTCVFKGFYNKSDISLKLDNESFEV